MGLHSAGWRPAGLPIAGLTYDSYYYTEMESGFDVEIVHSSSLSFTC
jgi:hypothetical protein